jgi:hypothetical protein
MESVQSFCNRAWSKHHHAIILAKPSMIQLVIEQLITVNNNRARSRPPSEEPREAVINAAS